MNKYTERPKSKIINLDETDHKILRILQNEGRLPMVELARRIHLTTTPCTERVKRLELEGLIDHYAAVISPEKLGINLIIFIHVRLNQNNMTVFKKFANAISKINAIEECYSLTGEFDMMLKVRVAGMSDYQAFMANDLPHFPGIIQSRSEVVIKEFKRFDGFQLDRN